MINLLLRRKASSSSLGKLLSPGGGSKVDKENSEDKESDSEKVGHGQLGMVGDGMAQIFEEVFFFLCMRFGTLLDQFCFPIFMRFRAPL